MVETNVGKTGMSSSVCATLYYNYTHICIKIASLSADFAILAFETTIFADHALSNLADFGAAQMMILLHLILRGLPKPVGWIVLPETRLQLHRVSLLGQQVAIFCLGEVRLALRNRLSIRRIASSTRAWTSDERPIAADALLKRD